MAVTATRTDRVNLLDYDREGLRDYFVSIGEKPFRADQVIKWLYQHGVSEFSEMSNLAVSLREKLTEVSEIYLPDVEQANLSADGTSKWIFRLRGGNSCLLYTSPSPRDQRGSRMPSSA